MAEFSLTRDGFTHSVLKDGDSDRMVFDGGTVAVSRFGIFSFYRINTTSSVSRYRILAQLRSEVRFVFVLNGTEVRVGCDRDMRSFAAGESNCLLVKEGCTQELTVAGDGAAELCMLVVGLSDISLPLTPHHQSHLREFLEGACCRWLLTGQNLVLGMRKIGVIQQILHEKKPAYLRAAYIQVKLAELFVLFLERVGKFQQNETSVPLRPDELDRMRKVRDMLHDDLAASYSLTGLAHAVGTNETTLKTHFKALYGVTVFGYLTACRMERAKMLLAEGNLKVSMVAQEVGYKYASHFSTAFRKYFGYLPTKILRMFVPVQTYLSIEAFVEAYTGCLAIL